MRPVFAGRLEEVQNGLAISSNYVSSNPRSSITYPNGREIVTTFDALNRINTIADDGVARDIASYKYNGPGRILEIIKGNGTRLTHLNDEGTTLDGYDSLGREIERRRSRADNSLIVGLASACDRLDNKLYEEKLHDLPHSKLYSYDSVYRLINFKEGALNDAKDEIATPLTTQTWQLDGLGDWRDSETNGVLQTTDVNALNQYISINNGGNVTTPTHDDNGSVTDDGT